MTAENLERLEECEENLNDIINTIYSIFLDEKKYKELLENNNIKNFEHRIFRSESICSLLYRSVYSMDEVMNDLIRFTEDGIAP